MRFFLLILIVFNSCENSVEVAQYKNFVKLQGQNDHSGIIVKILELNQFSITDSMGYFELPDLADGKYSLEIKYPYFKTHKEEINFEKGHQANYINIELKRLFQFWIEPKDTSISLSDYSNQEPFLNNSTTSYEVIVLGSGRSHCLLQHNRLQSALASHSLEIQMALHLLQYCILI